MRVVFYRPARNLAVLTIAVLCASFSFVPAWAQSTDQKIIQHLNSGEFPAAIQLAEKLSGSDADSAFKSIAEAQFKSGADYAALDSVTMIKSDLYRANILSGQYDSGSYGSDYGDDQSSRNDRNSPGGSGVPGANRGGITLQDFTPLIDLIKSTVDPESWDDTNGDGTIQAYPAGVYVDSSGTLHRLRIDRKRQLKKLQRLSALDSGNRQTTEPSNLRKISLMQLEKQAQMLAAQGRPVDDIMQNLAGLYGIEYLMLMPESGDIVIAGPAGPWEMDQDGRPINTKTKLPVLQLDDLVVCLRNAWNNDGKFGCSINPRQESLAETQEFLATTKLRGKAWRDGIQSALGQQDVVVFGIDQRTHAGRVLVEADYRMKLIGMGLEKSISEVPSYLSRVELDQNGQLPPMDVVRWWFTMNYDDVVADESLEVFTFSGTGVKVLSENELLDDLGNRIHTGQSKGHTAGFARDFTTHFTKLAKHYPVYQQLKNVFDMAIVSAVIRNQELDKKAGWNLTYFRESDSYGDLVYQPRLSNPVTQVNSVMNHRVISERKQRSTLKHTLVGVSGGINFDAMKVAVNSKVITDSSGRLAEVSKNAKATSSEAKNWWWD